MISRFPPLYFHPPLPEKAISGNEAENNGSSPSVSTLTLSTQTTATVHRSVHPTALFSRKTFTCPHDCAAAFLSTPTRHGGGWMDTGQQPSGFWVGDFNSSVNKNV